MFSAEAKLAIKWHDKVGAISNPVVISENILVVKLPVNENCKSLSGESLNKVIVDDDRLICLRDSHGSHGSGSASAGRHEGREWFYPLIRKIWLSPFENWLPAPTRNDFDSWGFASIFNVNFYDEGLSYLGNKWIGSDKFNTQPRSLIYSHCLFSCFDRVSRGFGGYLDGMIRVV